MRLKRVRKQKSLKTVHLFFAPLFRRTDSRPPRGFFAKEQSFLIQNATYDAIFRRNVISR